MSNTICICCAGRMTVPSPRNPNICPGCEQLLEDDCAALGQFMTETPPAEVAAHLTVSAATRESVPADR